MGFRRAFVPPDSPAVDGIECHAVTRVDEVLFGAPNPAASRDEVISALLPYAERQLALGGRLNHVTRHIMGLYQGVPGARRFRRHLSENAYREGAGLEVLKDARALVDG